MRRALSRQRNHRYTARPVLAGLLAASLAVTACHRAILDGERWLTPAANDTFRAIDPLELPKPSPRPDATGKPVDPIPKSVDAADSMALRVEDARSAALEHNLDLAVDRISPHITYQSVDEERARFEAAFVTDAQISSTSTVEIPGQRVYGVKVEPGIRIPLRTGGTATVGLPLGYAQVEGPGTFSAETYEAGVRFSLSQPLLRGAGRFVNTAPIRVARLQSRRAEARTKLSAIRLLANAERAYWSLWAATKEVEIRHDQYLWSEEQVAQARRLAEAGAAPHLEITRAESGVARRLQAIISTETTRRIVERNLKSIMNRPDLPVGGTTVLRPETEPCPRNIQLDRVALAAHAVRNRMEMLETELDLAVDAVTVGVARNETLPAFALGFDYTLGGQKSHFVDALEEVVDNPGDVQLGAQIEVPLGNRAARARLYRAVLQRARTLATRDAMALSIRHEVYDALDNLESSWQRVLTSRKEVLLAGLTYEGEKRQFQSRVRTSSEVLEAAAILADARSGEADALADYQVALVEIAYATGTVLGHGRVHWARPSCHR